MASLAAALPSEPSRDRSRQGAEKRSRAPHPRAGDGYRATGPPRTGRLGRRGLPFGPVLDDDAPRVVVVLAVAGYVNGSDPGFKRAGDERFERRRPARPAVELPSRGASCPVRATPLAPLSSTTCGTAWWRSVSQERGFRSTGSQTDDSATLRARPRERFPRSPGARAVPLDRQVGRFVSRTPVTSPDGREEVGRTTGRGGTLLVHMEGRPGGTPPGRCRRCSGS